MRKDRLEINADAEELPQKVRYTAMNWLVLCVSLTASAIAASLLPVETRSVFAGIILLLCTVLGVILFGAALASLFQKTAQSPVLSITCFSKKYIMINMLIFLHSLFGG